MKSAGAVAAGALVASVAVMTPTAAAGPAAGSVRTFQVTFVDDHRPVDGTASAPAQDRRTLITTITYPVGVRRPMPVVVLAHGYGGHPDKFSQLIGAWAAAGYVVAAPVFPLTSNLAPGGGTPGDVRNQPADVSFVIDEILKMGRAKSGGQLAGLVDGRHIGVAGLSLGGSTVYGLLFDSCCRDARIDAGVLMSALPYPFTDGKATWRRVPTLMVHSDADTKWYPVSEGTYPLLATPKWFVTLHGSSHSAPFEDTPDPADDVVRTITIAFWDRYLKGQDSAQTRIVDAVGAYGQADLTRDLR
jgi:predicted dienelactone hydrolase